MLQSSVFAAVAQDLARHEQQPETKRRYSADGITIDRTHFPSAGMDVPQHVHAYDHVSLLAAGSARVWADGIEIGILRAPDGLMIRAGVAHQFDILEDGTIIDCVHYTGRTGEIEITAEHQIVKDA